MPDDGPVVHIVDDSPAVRHSLSLLVETEGWGARAYATAEDLLDQVPRLADGCIVTDLRMPGLDGIGLIGALHDAGVGLPVLVVTGHADVPLAVQAMRIGASDVIEKPYRPDAIVAAIRQALRDRPPAGAAAEAEAGGVETRLSRLTPRERDVLRRLVQGKANKVIARDLGISPRTVEVYRAKIMEKTACAKLSILVRLVAEARPELGGG